MTVVDTPLRPDCRHVTQRAERLNAILDAHRRPDGTLDKASLVAGAVKARQDVQALEAVVNHGGVDPVVRVRLTHLQQTDIDHRDLLPDVIDGWDAAMSRTREDYPRCQKAKIIARTARSLGLWVPGERGPR